MNILGQWYEKPDVVKVIVKDYFKQRLTEPTPLQIRFGKIEFNSITEQDNEKLIGVISKDEIRAAVWQCDGTKSPGPAGFNFGFIKKALGNC